MGFFDFFKIFFHPSSLIVSSQDRELITKKWQEIENLMILKRPSAFKQAIIEADKLLAYTLEKMNYQGSLGDKLKASKNKFSQAVYNDLWEAHKIRNRLVHEVSAEINSFQAQKAIKDFKKGLRQLGIYEV